MFLKHLVIAVVFIYGGISCQQKQKSKSQSKDGHPDTLIAYLTRMSIDRPLDKLDTSIVHKVHEGDFEAYQKARKERVVRLIEQNNWERMSHYLWITPEEAEKLGEDFGIPSNHLLYRYLSDSNLTSPRKSQVLQELEEKLIKAQKDSIFYGMQEKRLLDTAFRIRVRKLHRH